MKRSSIFFTITLSFVISLFLVALSYIILHQINERKSLGERIGRYQPVARMLKRAEEKHEFSPNLLEDLKALGFKLIDDRRFIRKMKKQEDIKKAFEPPEIRRQHRKRREFSVYKKDGIYYIYVKGKYLLQDIDARQDTFILYITFAFFVIFLVLIVSFIVTIKKLKPIKELQERVKILGEENFTSLPKISNKKDEVSMLSNEFTKSALKLKQLKEARNVFIRNIMHELKTPITKGKILLELTFNKDKLQEIFNRLESLIGEFATVEEAVSKTKSVKKANYFLEDIVDNVEDMLFLDEDCIKREFENISLYVNFKYICLAIKNLVDNGLKYSPNKQVTIDTKEDVIIIKNIGNALDKPIESYKEPFGGVEDSRKNSFGLGLYIVHNILEVNGYMLDYEHVGDENIFICRPK